MGFDKKVVVLERQISLPIMTEGKEVMTEGKEVMMNFIVVNTFFPYMAILGWPWIHTMGVVLSTLHMKIKFPIEDGIVVFRVDQQVMK